MSIKTCPVCDTPYPVERTTCPTDGAVLIETHELVPGHIVRGKYKIVRKLGQGGMGVVYLAEHQMLGGQVALKFLATELSRNPQFVKRFRNEARAAYQLRHPNIVEVADLDQDEDGGLFIAMEFVNGPSLRLLMREAKAPLPADRALGIARGVASGLAAAHARGAVHRDIKPENILLSLDARRRIEAKVLDFGIATMTDNITDLSRTHGLLLTPEYASPEQWRGTPASELDGRTDLYALGGCLYEMLAGKTPFRAVNPEGWMYQHLNGTIEPLDTLRPDLERDYPGLGAVVMNLLARDRDQRLPSAMAFLEAIDGFEPQAEAHYVQSARLPKMQPGADAQANSLRQGTPAPLPTYGGNIERQTHATAERDAVAIGSVTAPRVSAAVIPTSADAPVPTSPSSRRSPLPLRVGIALAAVVAFAAAWFVFRPQPALPPAEVPGLSPAGGQFTTPQTVTITDGTPNAVIHYTLDGTPPTPSSPIYVAPFAPPNGTTLSAMALAPGHRQSPSVTGMYLWNIPAAPEQPKKESQTEPSRPQPPSPDVYSEGKSAFDHKQYAQAKSFFEQSCRNGNMDGCNYLGYLLSQGLGGPAEIDRARSIFTRACDGGNVSSCVSLGSLFQNAGDAPSARKYFKAACDKGNSQACSLLHDVQ